MVEDCDRPEFGDELIALIAVYVAAIAIRTVRILVCALGKPGAVQTILMKMRGISTGQCKLICGALARHQHCVNWQACTHSDFT